MKITLSLFAMAMLAMPAFAQCNSGGCRVQRQVAVIQPIRQPGQSLRVVPRVASAPATDDELVSTVSRIVSGMRRTATMTDDQLIAAVVAEVRKDARFCSTGQCASGQCDQQTVAALNGFNVAQLPVRNVVGQASGGCGSQGCGSGGCNGGGRRFRLRR